MSLCRLKKQGYIRNFRTWEIFLSSALPCLYKKQWYLLHNIRIRYIFSIKAVLATICTLGNNKNDLKDLCSKGKQPRYKALILGTCFLQEPGKWERQLGREMKQNRKTQAPSRQCTCQLPFQALCPHTSQMLRKLPCLTLQVPFLGHSGTTPDCQCWDWSSFAVAAPDTQWVPTWLPARPTLTQDSSQAQ